MPNVLTAMQLSSLVAHTGKQVGCLLKYTRVPSKGVTTMVPSYHGSQIVERASRRLQESNFNLRLRKQHQAVESGDCANSALAEHAWNCHHPVDWDCV